MTKTDRIPCINFRCNRTAPFDPEIPEQQIICRQCWRLLPVAMQRRVRSLERRERRVLRRVERRIADHTITAEVVERLAGAFNEQHHKAWIAIKHYLNAPTKPEGLDAFLETVGLG